MGDPLAGEKVSQVMKARASVRDQMGHSSIKVTFDTYGHLFPGTGKEASARYEKLMADAKVSQKRKAGVSNPLAIGGEKGSAETVTC